ncbi:hypothetical protein [Paraburkholderia phosphatilytica]|uniref:hypothetical protein n=1 Tax=Paraburkholderia phosphatilytica TaxID=2282883 RepID=UPI000E4EDED2|nr:hypothetical protein [Paraburkholderia phosphatilytica]
MLMVEMRGIDGSVVRVPMVPGVPNPPTFEKVREPTPEQVAAYMSTLESEHVDVDELWCDLCGDVCVRYREQYRERRD